MENLYPHMVKRIGKEVQEMIDADIEGIQLIVNDQDITDIQAIIDGPVDTPYEKGKFRIRLILSDNYPNVPPRGYFHTKIFHPNIAPETGEICVNTLKRDWKSDLGLKHILLVIRCLLLDPNPESALNEEAGRLLLEDYGEYVSQASSLTKVHACYHLRRDAAQGQLSSVVDVSTSNVRASTASAGDSHILRDTNSGPPRETTLKPMVQRQVSAAKKALKRL